MLVVPLILASLFLSPALHAPVHRCSSACWSLGSLPRIISPTQRTWVAVVVILLLCAIVLVTSHRRSRLGVAGAQGESMLVDLRDRIQRYGRLPDLPSQWVAESALRSAGGTLFAGDFIVASASRGRLDVAVVGRLRQGRRRGDAGAAAVRERSAA